MVPPPIRTKFEPSESKVSASSSQGWVRAFQSLWLGKSKDGCQQERAMSEDGCEDLVCLSPLSQFFCNVVNPPDIYANMTLAGHCSLQELVPPMQHMADLHDRFRRRLVFSFGAWRAEVLDNFDVRTLMREVTLDGTDAQQAYHQYMGKLMSEEPLGTHGLPPWDVFCIHYTCDPQRTDVLMRASHIIGDGQLFMKLIKQIMEPLNAVARADFHASITNARAGTPGVRKRGHSQLRDSSSSGGLGGSGGGSEQSSSADGGKQQQRLQQERSGSKLAGRRPQQLTQQQDEPKQLLIQQEMCNKQPRQRNKQRGLQHWWQLLAGLLHWCWQQYTALAFSWIMLFWFADPVTVIKASEQQCSGPRRWGSITISLPEFHHVAKTLGQSLNTLAVTCLAGGVRRYLQCHGVTPARRIRMCGMVDTRSMPGLLPGLEHGASNNFSFVGVPLYTGDTSEVERLERIGRAMSWIRHSVVVPIAIRIPDLIQTIFRHPEASSKAILRALPLKTTVGFSNMKGPAGSWSLSGYKVTKIHNGVQPMAFGSFISLFSYDSTLTFTHTCFETKTKKPEVLLECIIQEYHHLRKAASSSSSTALGDAPDSPSSCSDGGRIKAA